MSRLIIYILLSMCISAHAQFKSTIWCFGDSARIDFVNGTILSKKSSVVSRGSCFSIANQIDSLLFYGQTNYKINPADFCTNVYSSNDSLMQNSDSLRGEGAYQELVVVNKPNSLDTFYLFQSKIASTPQGLFYSTIDLSKNNGLGKIIKKNKKVNNYWQLDCINAVKHGNGKDWWIIARNWNQNILQPYNSWQVYLITENGITDSVIQNVGLTCITNNGYTAVSIDGKRIAFVSNMNIIEVYDFDRCTGVISNPIAIEQEIPFGGDANSGVEFSASGRFLYVSDLKENKISQYDLYSANISASKVILYDDSLSYDSLYFGMLKRAPDNKIYLTHWYIATGGSSFPYPANFHNQYTDNLSVINYPDSLGVSCGFSLCSFYLGGNRSYEGLPNNPNFEMGPDTGSFCDTLGLGFNEQNLITELKIFPNPVNDNLIVEIGDALKNYDNKIIIYNLLGCPLKQIETGYRDKINLSISAFSPGIYLLQLNNSKSSLILKFIKE